MSLYKCDRCKDSGWILELQEHSATLAVSCGYREMEKVKNQWLADDLFKGKVNESDINIVFEILNYRYLDNLPIIVSTEYTVERLLNFDEAIGSRIYEMCKDYIVEINKSIENNYRLK